jgi:hypothetical protein
LKLPKTRLEGNTTIGREGTAFSAVIPTTHRTFSRCVRISYGWFTYEMEGIVIMIDVGGLGRWPVSILAFLDVTSQI